MIDKIKELIASNDFIKADELINLELKSSFDFSKDDDSIKFNELNKLKDRIILDLLYLESKFSHENFRSTSNNQAQIRSYFFEEKYIEYLDSVEQKVITYNDSIKLDTTVHVLLTPNSITKGDDSIFTFLSEAGLYIDDPSYDGYDQIYLRGYEKNNDVNIKNTVDGLNNILNGVIEDGKETISIHFPHNNASISESALFLTLFSTLTSTTLFLINVETQLNKVINIFWSFDDGDIIKLFKKVITKAKIIKVKSQIVESTLNQLQARVFTKSEKYLKQLRSIANIIEEAEVPILIQGETGVGKSILAKIIHESSKRKGKFVNINCATVQDTLVESTLFGIKKGVATSVSQRDGKIKHAEGGTIFLDEIDRSSRKFRDTILTVIDNKEYIPIGEEKSIKADVRFIYGSNKDFEKLIEEKEFELDFLYRINERTITIPPLRERTEDIEGIIFYILNELNETKGSNIDITSDVISMISKMELKGNIRDLNSIIKYGFYESLNADKFGVISLDYYKDYVISYKNLAEEFYLQLDLAKKLMLNYNPLKEKLRFEEGGKFNLIKDFIMPIFAHVFLNEIYDEKTNSPDKSLAEQICGSSMERGNAATIRKKALDFSSLKKQF
ncbi:MAG: sigma 54-interacting transcriptional regulator [Melioribacteraceae bacterium]